MNWIVLTITIILLINIATVYSVSGINIILIIICFIFVLTVTSRNERLLEMGEGKFFSIHRYIMDSLIENNMIPITSQFTGSYSNKFSCDNNVLNPDGTVNDNFIPSHKSTCSYNMNPKLVEGNKNISRCSPVIGSAAADLLKNNNKK